MDVRKQLINDIENLSESAVLAVSAVVAEFIEMQSKTADVNPTPVRPPFKLKYGRGCMKGKIKMADDFDEPLEDFAEYM